MILIHTAISLKLAAEIFGDRSKTVLLVSIWEEDQLPKK